MVPDTLMRASLLLQAKFNFSRQSIKGQDAVQLVPQGTVSEEKKKYSDLKKGKRRLEIGCRTGKGSLFELGLLLLYSRNRNIGNSSSTGRNSQL